MVGETEVAEMVRKCFLYKKSYPTYSYSAYKTCFVLDLRKNTWEWDDSVIAELNTARVFGSLVYVEKKDRLYHLGGTPNEGVNAHPYVSERISFDHTSILF